MVCGYLKPDAAIANLCLARTKRFPIVFEELRRHQHARRIEAKDGLQHKKVCAWGSIARVRTHEKQLEPFIRKLSLQGRLRWIFP